MDRAQALWKLQMRSTCAHCNTGIPINGPLRTVKCSGCLVEQDVSHVWPWLIEIFSNETYRSEGRVTIDDKDVYTFERASPACPECGLAVDEELVSTGADHAFECGQCGARLETYPAPDWLKEIDPAFTQVCFGLRADAPDGSHPMQSADEPEPVAMSCPKCGAGLELTGRDQRTTQCQFCQARVYIPDPLWLILHPAPTMRPWYVRVEGETQPEREQRAEREREQERQQRAEREREQKRQRDREKQERERAAEAEREREHERAMARKQRLMVLLLSLLVVAVLAAFGITLL